LPLINRCVVIVKPKKSFLEWCREAIPDRELTLDSLRREPGTYLLSEYTYDAEQPEVLRNFFDLIFDIELQGWVIDEDLWPRDRRFEVFQKWFDLEFSSMVVDLVDAPLQHDEDEQVDA